MRREGSGGEQNGLCVLERQAEPNIIQVPYQ